jgi:hypothetical protein
LELAYAVMLLWVHSKTTEELFLLLAFQKLAELAERNDQLVKVSDANMCYVR